MNKKLSYRKAKKGIAEQYGISINKEFIKKLGITKEEREVTILFNNRNKCLLIMKK